MMVYRPRRRYTANYYNRRTQMVMYKRPTYKRPFVKGKDRTVGNYKRFNNGGRDVEKKFYDNILNDVIVASIGAIISSLHLIPQNLTGTGRIGRKVVLKKIRIRYDINLPLHNDVADVTGGDVCRVMLYLDKQCNGAAATAADIIKTDSDYESFRKLSNSDRFEILYDKWHDINYTSGVGDGSLMAQPSVFHHYAFNKTCNIPVEFSSTTGVITEIRSNNVGMMLISKAGRCGFKGAARVRYTDA